MAMPLTMATVSASPTLSSVDRCPCDHSQQANTSPAYWIGRERWGDQRREDAEDEDRSVEPEQAQAGCVNQAPGQEGKRGDEQAEQPGVALGVAPGGWRGRLLVGRRRCARCRSGGGGRDCG